MAARRKVRGKEAELAFEALSIEGGLLSADWLARAAQLSAGNQTEADYRVPKGMNLRDEIGRYWRIAQAHWREFAAGRSGGAEPRALAERFVQGLLRESFGFVTLAKAEPLVLAERTYPIGFAALGGHVPVVIVAPRPESTDDKTRSALDDPKPDFADGGRRRTAFGLAQEYLNAAEGAMWGLTSDGLTLRILRDNASLTRPAWIEADLASLFSEERYADFAALWLLAHETRFGAADRPPSECALEVWRAAGREEGTRAREHLRQGVEDALVALGHGFLSHPDNQAVRGALETGALTRDALFQQLLRLVYRLIFLLTVEERGLLHEPGASEAARSLYAQGYGVRRLRDRSVRRSAYDRAGDLWDALRIVLRGMARGELRLGLPALGGLFDPEQCPDLDAARLENRALLLAIFRLGWLRQDGALARVNWRDMGPEELGSVYESLLELVPVIPQGGRSFTFATGGETRGNARKTTGSYYTPDSLVQVLLDSALEPVVATTIAENPQQPAEALLALSIVDPACGSGHFLLSAARRLAAHVARIEANGTPSVEQYRHALRQVVGRCLFGVDLNPMAVELCKVSLWMEAVEPGRPLSFLDAHVQRGNALLGTTPELMVKGIPDAAWEPIEGDDKRVASALKKQNKQEARELSLNFSRVPASTYARIGAGARAVDEEDDATLPSIEAKAKHWAELVASAGFEHQRFVADTWCAAFVWRKEAGPLREAAPTNGTFWALQNDGSQVSRVLREEVERLRAQYAWFHWPLRFPQVFAKGGFDVLLGNPPWDALRLIEKEFFAASRPEIVEAEVSATRKSLISALERDEPELFRAYKTELRFIDGINSFVVGSKLYPLCGVGRVNLFALFAERNLRLMSENGRVGVIVPTAIATDDSTKMFFQTVVDSHRLVSLLDFQSGGELFGRIGHARFKFCLLTLGAADKEPVFAFGLRATPELRSDDRVFELTAADLALLNPKTRTCPVFLTRRDASLTAGVYRRWPLLPQSGWEATVKFPLDVGRTSAEFTRDLSSDSIPLYEGKYFHQFEHRWATRDGSDDRSMTHVERADPSSFVRPRYAFPNHRIAERYAEIWPHAWVVVWRDIARSTDERTFIAAVVPSLAVAHTAWLMLVAEKQVRQVGVLLANMNSFAFDFIVRQKNGGTHMAAFIVEQLPVLTPATYEAEATWQRGTALRDWILPRVLELTYTAWDLEPFARDVGYEGPPFKWNAERRRDLRAELDAAFFHLYQFERGDVEYVMETFPIVRRNDEKLSDGMYRTKDAILEIYGEMAEAARTGKPYQTRLSPPPADSRVAHPPREGGRVIPLRPAVRPQPAIQPAAVPPHAPRREVPTWSPELLPAVATKTGLAASAGRWGTTLTGVGLGIAALAAVLRHMGRPASRDEVERAAVLSILPSLLQSKFDAQTGAKWRRAIGTANMNLTSIASLSIPWAEVLRRAALEHLLQVDADGRWSAGADVVDAPSAELDARAQVSIAWLESASAASEDGELITQLGVLRAA